MRYQLFDVPRKLQFLGKSNFYLCAYFQEHHVTELDKEVLECWSETIRKMELNGAKIIKVSLPHSYLMLPCYTVLTCVEVSSNMARYDGLRYGFRSSTGETTDEVYGYSRAEGFGPTVRRRILSGTYFSLRKYD